MPVSEFGWNFCKFKNLNDKKKSLNMNLSSPASMLIELSDCRQNPGSDFVSFLSHHLSSVDSRSRTGCRPGVTRAISSVASIRSIAVCRVGRDSFS